MRHESNREGRTATSPLPLEQEHFEALQRMRMLAPYYRWTFSLLQPHMGQRVMDAGCGTGNFTEVLAESCDYVLAVDLSPRNVELLGRRFEDSPNVKVLRADIAQDLAAIRAQRIDTIVCLDVLEHIEDDVALLAAFREAIQPGGKLLLKVPACTWLYGSVDVASSHYRRYGKAALVDRVARAGWQPVSVRYMNIFGVLPYWIKSRVLKKQTNFSTTFPAWQIQLIRTVMPVLKVIDGLIGPPIGQSLVLVAE